MGTKSTKTLNRMSAIQKIINHILVAHDEDLEQILDYIFGDAELYSFRVEDENTKQA